MMEINSTNHMTQISYCVLCRFFRRQQTATESGDKCLVGLAPCNKDGGMTADPKDFGCVAWEEIKS